MTLSLRARRLTAVAIASGTAFLLASASADAQTAQLAVETAEPEITKADDGSRSLKLTVVNLTEAELKVSLLPAGTAEDCQTADLTPQEQQLKAGRAQEITFKIGEGCDADTNAIDLTVAPSLEGSGGVSFTAAVKDEEEKPDWNKLLILPVALLILTLLGLAVFTRGKFAKPLPSLPAAWTLKDSWVSNITVVAAVLVPLFTSAQVVKELIGEGGDAAIALATAGGALAAGFVGLAPIVLYATKSRLDSKYYFSVYGVVLATAFVLAAAVGQLLVGYFALKELNLDGAADAAVLAGLLVALLILGVSVVRSLLETLETGLPEPSTKPSETYIAAAMIAGAIKNEGFTDDPSFRLAVDSLAKYLLPDEQKDKTKADKEIVENLDQAELDNIVRKSLHLEAMGSERPSALP